MKKLSKLTLCAFLLSVSTASIAESRLVVWEDNGKGYGIEKAARNFAKENGCEFIRTKEGKYVLTKGGYCSQEFGNDAVFEKAANVGKTPEEIAKNPFNAPDIGNKPETPKKGLIGRFKNNGGR